jgi:hypothetical protein
VLGAKVFVGGVSAWATSCSGGSPDLLVLDIAG